VLEQAARIDPLAPVIIANLARKDLEMGATAKAEGRLRQLLGVPRPSELVYHQLWELYLHAGRLVEATDMAKRFALSSASASGRPLLRPLIESYQSLGLWEKAERWLSRNEGLGPGYEPLHARYLASQGRFREAVTRYGAALQSEGGDLERLPPRQAIPYGILQTWAGDYEGAVRTLEPLRGDRLSRVSAFGNDDEMDALQHLAWAYQETGASDRAAEILDALEAGFIERQADGRLHRSTILYAFAENARLSGSASVAANRLQKAVEAGWRGYHVTPDWHPYLKDAEYASIMAAVKTDVNAQRAVVLRREAEDDFVERLDTTIANAAPR
jgi:tetratricopeptide (TPR) repeat protein